MEFTYLRKYHQSWVKGSWSWNSSLGPWVMVPKRNFSFICMVLKLKFLFRTMTHGPKEEFQLLDQSPKSVCSRTTFCQKGQKLGYRSDFFYLQRINLVFCTLVLYPKQSRSFYHCLKRIKLAASMDILYLGGYSLHVSWIANWNKPGIVLEEPLQHAISGVMIYNLQHSNCSSNHYYNLPSSKSQSSFFTHHHLSIHGELTTYKACFGVKMTFWLRIVS